eukprot:TRINITY_DN8590_c0_g1_i1.p1 TRINITY_DN8590_c0_g1~~TRINITY_DN8590_c0_g1_i1.p1  ORF type:complete len:299 (-),score=53.42 TRINITY_DN8590_c0_g1_i1:13-909(-)
MRCGHLKECATPPSKPACARDEFGLHTGANDWTALPEPQPEPRTTVRDSEASSFPLPPRGSRCLRAAMEGLLEQEATSVADLVLTSPAKMPARDAGYAARIVLDSKAVNKKSMVSECKTRSRARHGVCMEELRQLVQRETSIEVEREEFRKREIELTARIAALEAKCEALEQSAAEADAAHVKVVEPDTEVQKLSAEVQRLTAKNAELEDSLLACWRLSLKLKARIAAVCAEGASRSGCRELLREAAMWANSLPSALAPSAPAEQPEAGAASLVLRGTPEGAPAQREPALKARGIADP